MTHKTRPALTTITTRDIEKFAALDKSQYVPKRKPKKVTRSLFDTDLSHVHATFG